MACPKAALLLLFHSAILWLHARAMQFDLEPHGQEFCLNRDAHHDEKVGIRYAVHRPLNSLVVVTVRPVAGPGGGAELLRQGPAVTGLAQFHAPLDGTFRLCFASPRETHHKTTVSIAVLVEDGAVALEEALEKGQVISATDLAHVASSTLRRILFQQDEFQEAVWRHDIAMVSSATSAERASILLCFLVALVSVGQGMYMRSLLKGKRGSGHRANSIRARV